MFLSSSINESMVDIGLGTAGLVALLGYAVVFFGLVLLMWVIMILGKIMVSSQKKKAASVSAAQAAPAPAAALPAAAGTAGEIKLYNVSEKDAAMIMAIVANKLQRPLNELRFKSIKEV